MIGLMFTWKLSHSIANGIIAKNNSNAFAGKGSAGFFLYSCLTTVSGVIFFFCVSGFRIECNIYTLLYSFAYASVILLNYLMSLFIYKFETVAVISVATTTGRVPMIFMFGVLLFNEDVTFFKMCSLMLMIMATYLAMIGKTSRYAKKGVTRSFILLLMFKILLEAASDVIQKYYAMDTRVCNQNSLFLMTNALMFVFACIGFLYQYTIDMEETKEICQSLSVKDYLLAIIQTVGDNITSIVNVLLLAQIELSVFSVLSSAIGLLGSVGASVYLKEKNNKKLYVSVIMAIIAIVFNVM